MTATFDWSAVAPAWDSRREHLHRVNAPVTTRLLDLLHLRAGDRVLEIGAGTGELALAMADQVAPDGRVVASDSAAGMVEVMRRTVQGHAGSPIVVRQLDACDTGLPAGSVDAVVCQMGLMIVTEPPRALAEWHRVLAADGRLALAVWAGPEHNPWLANVGMTAMLNGVFAGGPPTAPGGVFSLGDPEVLRQMVGAAGFTEVTVEQVAAPARYADSNEHFDSVTAVAGPLAVAISAADDGARATVRAAVAAADAGFTTDDGLVLPGLAHVVRGRA